MDVTKMTCCPENVTFSRTWMNYGISTCAMEIIADITILLYLLVFGTKYLLTHVEHRTDVDSNKFSKSGLHQLQIFLLLLMPIFSVLNIILQAKQIYGFMIISTILSLIAYPYFIYILNVEGRKKFSAGNSKVIIGFWMISFVMENFVFINTTGPEWPLVWITRLNYLDTIVPVLRYATSLLLFTVGLFAAGDFEKKTNNSKVKEKSESTFPETEPGGSKSSLKNSWHGFKSLAYFLWPQEDILLQLRVVTCFVLLFAGNAVNVLKPLYDKKIIDSVTDYPGEFRWELVVIYVGIDIFREMLQSLQSFLWNRVEEYAACKAEVEIFRHLHSLSLRWHLERKTGEVLRIMDRGADALRYLLYYVLFVILPTTVDAILAVLFFISVFDKWLGLIIFSSMILYFVISLGLTEWRTKIQERMNQAENDQKARSVDSLLNFETVKCYGAESYEVECFKRAILDSQIEASLSDITRQVFDIMQNIIDNFATLAGSLLCLYMIVNNKGLTIGDYVLFTSYLSQLQQPLNQLAYSYRYIHEQFVDMDSLIKLLQGEPDIVDSPDATTLKIEDGRIEFSDVSFSYLPEKVILKNVSFVVPAGKTIALVGPSGAGKSTIMRLLFRFYDVKEGSIFVDNQDIKSVKQDSLRKSIGVVPQDIVLFNNTIKHNIQYGKIDASDEEVIEAAKHADIHDRILSFPDGYETEVGERGLRLSGGEKQRVAIARTILKAPKIVLLDEATSALDTQTERNIQAALNRVCANRTTIIIAHRLSTIIHADEILVLKEGEIIERGKHEDLIAQGGHYRDMWEAQFKKEEEEVVVEKPLDDSTEYICNT